MANTNKLVAGLMASALCIVAGVSTINTFAAACDPNALTDSCDVAVNLTIDPGILTIVSNPTVNLSSLTVSDEFTESTGTTSAIIMQDLRGTNEGWSATTTMTNFVGQTDANKFLNLASTTNAAVSYLALTPSALTVSAGDPGTLTGVTDSTTLQETTTLSALNAANGVSNAFSLASFSTGNGAGKYEKTVGISLDVPPYTFAQAYQSTMTLSIA